MSMDPIGRVDFLPKDVSLSYSDVDRLEQLLLPPRGVKTTKREWRVRRSGDMFPGMGATAEKAGVKEPSDLNTDVQVEIEYSDGAGMLICLALLGSSLEWKRGPKWIERRAKKIAAFLGSREPLLDDLIYPDPPASWRGRSGFDHLPKLAKWILAAVGTAVIGYLVTELLP